MRFDWIQTYTGIQFYPLDPKIESINIEDIAHSLSMLCRFTGHCREFYSVAQHCVLASYIPEYKYQLSVLLHDSAEAYIGDIAKPFKRSLMVDISENDSCIPIDIINIENRITDLIYKKFQVEHHSTVIKECDQIMFATEVRDLMVHFLLKEPKEPLLDKITPWTPKVSENKFLQRFAELGGFSGETK
jgi:hypothetical protein